MKILKSNRGDVSSALLGVAFLLFLIITAAMYFLIPRKVIKVETTEAELVKKVVKFSASDIEKLTLELEKRENLLKQKEKFMQEQEQRISSLNKELGEVKNEILKYQGLISQTVTEVVKEEKKNIKKLAKVFGLMGPEDAVAIIKKLDDNTVASILSSMKERASAKILGQYANKGDIDAERVARISEMMKKLTTVGAKP